MKERLNAKWITLQGAAILGSILLAFAIEAWWSDRQEEEQEAHAQRWWGSGEEIEASSLDWLAMTAFIAIA